MKIHLPGQDLLQSCCFDSDLLQVCCFDIRAMMIMMMMYLHRQSFCIDHCKMKPCPQPEATRPQYMMSDLVLAYIHNPEGGRCSPEHTTVNLRGLATENSVYGSILRVFSPSGG